MIHRISSSLPTFKTLNFHEGLNVVLATRTPKATNRQTRNRAGKSSVVEILHFLLGSDVRKGSLFKAPELAGHSFTLDFDLRGSRVVVERRVDNPSEIIVREGFSESWPDGARRTLDGDYRLSNKKWKQVLAELLFAFDPAELKDQHGGKYVPSVRSLLGYFARREREGGFMSPVLHSKDQKPYDSQVSISFLLGLDWTIPQQLQFVRDRESSLEALRVAAKTGALGNVISGTAELRTDLTVAEGRARRLKANLADFRVYPEYRALESEASNLSQQLSALVDDNSVDRTLLAELQLAMRDESPPKQEDLESLYAAAGIHLPEAVLTRFDDVRLFHESVVRNRRAYLEAESTAVESRIGNRTREIESLDRRRAEVMATLRTHGALEQFFELQAELARLEAQTEALRQRYAAAETLEGESSELEIDRQKLLRRLQQDHSEQEDVLMRAISVFEDISESLYEDAGQLTIVATPNGPEFGIRIQGKRSKGVANMQIFCFDLMLCQLAVAQEISPNFLVHDSHLFDGVDERQTAAALSLGAARAAGTGFQYIVTLNSDDVPTTWSDDFSLTEYIVPVDLTDATVDGGLFGFRFG